MKVNNSVSDQTLFPCSMIGAIEIGVSKCSRRLLSAKQLAKHDV